MCVSLDGISAKNKSLKINKFRTKTTPWYASLMTLLMTVYAVIATNETAFKGFVWVEYNDKFDCIVGITVDGQPVSSGVFITKSVIITSANPIERVASNKNVNVHTINSEPTKNKIHEVMSLARDQSRRNTMLWQSFGFNDRHSPIHDFLLINLYKDIPNAFNPSRRQPYVVDLYREDIFDGSGVFTYAGFGFIDQLHVKENFELDPVEVKSEDILINCDEWIPRVWGNFICLQNNEKFVCISSGAGLFYNDVLVGIGAFAVTKGNESILVFTDLRKYYGAMFYVT